MHHATKLFFLEDVLVLCRTRPREVESQLESANKSDVQTLSADRTSRSVRHRVTISYFERCSNVSKYRFDTEEILQCTLLEVALLGAATSLPVRVDVCNARRLRANMVLLFIRLLQPNSNWAVAVS